MQVGKTYLVSRGNIKPANHRYCKSAYDISVTNDTTIEETDDDSSVPDRSDTFIPLNKLGHPRFLDTQNDVIGVVRSIDPLSQIASKRDNSTINKLQIHLVDDTLYEVYESFHKCFHHILFTSSP